MRLRPLLTAGVVLLVPEQTAHVLVAQGAYERAEQSLADRQLAEWVVSQVLVAGPSEPEVAWSRFEMTKAPTSRSSSTGESRPQRTKATTFM
jgi:hypothetical protein